MENIAWPCNQEDEIFSSAPNTYVTSFVLMENDMAICHVGIRKSILHHKMETYSAYGISEVVTHPLYRKQGLATRTIQKAKEFIISQRPDISIFTCAKDKIHMYSRCGWTPLSNSYLVGGSAEKTFRSDSLELTTMIILISSKAKLHSEDFECTDIIINLGEGNLW